MGSPFVRTFLLFILLHVKGTHVLATRCPDGRTTCDAESTCCPVAADQYLPQANRWPFRVPLSGAKFGCCPLANAVCCSTNSSSNLASQSWCCPSGFTCNVEQGTCNQKVTQGNSCTETNFDSSQSEGCTCPTGSVFNNTSNQCQSALFKVQLARDATRVRSSSLCPGGEYRCPEGDTCCKLDEGFGCCQGIDAVCCDDKLHCCPNGYECTATACRKV